jgi:hypothetical protein
MECHLVRKGKYMVIQENSKCRTQVVLCECRFKPDLRASGKLTFIATLMERGEMRAS